MAEKSVAGATRRLIGRRGFLRAVPAAFASGLAAPASARQADPTAVTNQAVEGAEEIVGLDFTPEEQEMMLERLARNRSDYEALREIEIPLDTEPAVSFHPHLAGQRPTGGATPNAEIALSPPTPLSIGASVEELAFLPVRTLARLIRERIVTSAELTTMYLERLKQHGDTLKCVVTVTEDLALEQAARADAEIAAGRIRGPLHGIPWGAKDLLATKGIRTTWGAKPYEHQVIDYDATVVERLAEAGAVLVAKLSMGALAQGGVWFSGSTRNPWNLERGSGGSSAGPGAATAAGLVGFSIGTETRGSIISPSAACGVTGLRPTYGRVSRYGAMALSWTMDKIGPMCRSVEDCALVFNAIYGPDGRDDTVADAPFDWSPDESLADLRVGYIQREFEAPPEGASDARREQWETQQPALTAALESLRGAGATLEPIEMPDFPANAIGFVLSAEAAAAFDDLTRSRGVDQLTRQTPNAWPNSFRTSRFIPAVEYLRAQRARRLLMRRMDELMSTYDVFISPPRSGSLGVTNLTGHPALALKAGFAEGMPVALMFTGRLYDEATLLRAALAFERATPWHTQHPTPLEAGIDSGGWIGRRRSPRGLVRTGAAFSSRISFTADTGRSSTVVPFGTIFHEVYPMRISRLMAIGICAGLAVASVTAGQKRIIPRETPSNAPFSPAVVAGDFIYLSGTLARGDGIQAQAKAVLDTLGNVLERAGASFDRVAAVTVYLKNPSDFQGMNEVFRTYWPTDPPTRTTVQANLVREDALIEISMVAIRPGAERQVIHPEGWPSNAAPYSYGIKSGDTVFLAGIVGRKYREGANVDGDIQVETRSIFDNARQILDAAGMSLAEVVSSRVYITDTSMFGDMNTAYREHFPDMPPARATVRAGLMGSRYHLEITMVAVSGERERIIRPNVDGSPGRPSATLSHAVRVGNRLYVSGMLGVNDDTRGDTTAQARAALASIGRTLEAADFGWGDLVDGVVYLTDMGNWADMNVAYREVITEDFPARAAVGTGLMNADGLVEIMFTAAK